MDWHALLRQHDEAREVKRTKKVVTSSAHDEENTGTTALQLVVGVLQHTLPVVCQPLWMSVAWKYIVTYAQTTRRRRWFTSLVQSEYANIASESYKRDYLTRAQRWLWDIIVSKQPLSSSITLTPPRLDSPTTERQCQLYAQMLVEYCRRCQWTSTATHHIQTIVWRTALQLLQTAESLVPTLPTDAAASRSVDIPPTTRRKRRRAHVLEITHDKDDISDTEGKHKVPFKVPRHACATQVSLPRLLKQSAHRATPVHTINNTNILWRQPVFELTLSCAATYHKRLLMDNVWTLIVQSDPAESAVLRFYMVTVLLSSNNTTLTTTTAPTSSNLLILEEWMSKLLKHATDGVVSSSLAWSWFSELVVELAALDRVDVFERVTAPFLRQGLHVDPTKDMNPWKRAFLHMLEHRGPWFQAVPDFALVKARLSLQWPRASNWMSPAMPFKEQQTFLMILQQAGILGVCETVDCGSTDASGGKASHTEWPFPDWQSIRETGQRCGQMDLVRSICSKRDPFELQKALRPTSDPARVREFWDNFAHGDILLHIFGFLGIKRMAQIPLVCRGWQQLADHPRLWRALFASRYGTHQEDPTLVRNDAEEPWKKHFHYRFIVEQEIRGRSSKSNRKLCICRFVGCHAILSTPLQLKRHYATHQRKNPNGADNACQQEIRNDIPRKKKKTKKVMEKQSRSADALAMHTKA